MNSSQIIRILKARAWLVLAIFASVVTVVGALTFILPKRYMAAVTLVIDSKGTDPVTGALMPFEMMSSRLATQVDIIESHNVALKVVDMLHLTELAAAREEFRDETDGMGSMRDWLADRLLKKLKAKPSRESSLIDITYTSADPQVAAQMANAFADAYVRASIELKADPARRQAGWFEGQVGELRATLEGAQRKLSEYQQQHQILATDVDHLDVENARLAELSSQLSAAQTQMLAAQTRRSQMTHALAHDRVAEMPDIAANPVVQNLKAEIAHTEARVAEISGRYGRNHPNYRSAAAELDALQTKLAAELGTSQGSIDQAAEIAHRQVTELYGAVKQQRSRVLELSELRDKLAVLTRDVQGARTAYEAALQRTTHVRLESELNQTDVAILNPAVAPIKPVFPMVGLNLMLAAMLGLLCGAGSALVLEMNDRRVRARGDVMDVAGIPVLAELSRIERRHRRRAAQRERESRRESKALARANPKRSK